MHSAPDLPSWLKPRPYQWEAVEEIIDAYDAGAQVVFLDAPTGSGKTAIAELVRRQLQARATYVCSDKQLQRQFMRDFPYAKLLQGRANYTPMFGRGVTAEDCTAAGANSECMYCDPVGECSYRVAKDAALRAELAVLNTAYFLSAANYTKAFSDHAELIVVDEGDALEDSLMGFIEYRVPEWIGRKLNLTYPIKGARKPTLVKWANDAWATGLSYQRSHLMMPAKDARKIGAWMGETKRLAIELARDPVDDEDAGQWLRTYDTRTFAMQPVQVGRYGTRTLWRHAQRWLVMSATIISPHEMADSLGLPYEWACVTVPSQFPAANRPIVLAPIANVSYKLMDDAVPKLAYAIERILEDHPGDRVLVHSQSYDLTKRLVEAVKTDRFVLSYTSAKGKQEALSRFLGARGAVLVAPSMERGVDLKDDACRVQIVAKCPFPSLGDRRISARMHLPGGDQWYRVQTIRDIVQMTGRGVRSDTDTCTTYILDEQFTRNVWRSRSLFPKWWQEAVDTKFDIRHLVKPRVRA